MLLDDETRELLGFGAPYEALLLSGHVERRQAQHAVLHAMGDVRKRKPESLKRKFQKKAASKAWAQRNKAHKARYMREYRARKKDGR